MIGRMLGIKKVSGGVSDPDAQAFIDAAVITDGTQQNAIDQLVIDLKGFSLWTKMQAIYPFVGGTASTHKWNLKDPRDLDAAYRLTYDGGDALTHSSTGVKGGGVSTATTYLKPSDMGQNSVHVSCYLRDLDSSTNNAEVGVVPDVSQFYLAVKYSGVGNSTISNLNHSGLNDFTTAGVVTGLYVSSRVGLTSHTVYKPASTYTVNNTSIAPTSGNIVLFGTAAAPCLKEFAFASIGDGLSSLEVSNFQTAVQTYQTSLSRQV